MTVTRNDIAASRIELIVTVSADEMRSFAEKAAARLSEQTTIEGFRPGKAPFEMVKKKVGDMAILDEASRIAVSKTIDQALKEKVSEDWVGQPEITIIKIAPDNDFEYKIMLTLLPSTTLGEYKDFGFKKELAEVSEEEITKVVDHLRETRVIETAAERESQDGDKMILDINMSLDNVPLENGQGKDLALVLGKEYVVPGFDEKVKGMKKDDERNFELMYPVDYHQKQLAGKKVSFKVKAKEVFARTLPELDEGFALGFGLKSVDELKKNIKHSLEHEKKHEADFKLEGRILEKIVSNAQFGEIPDMLVSSEVNTMLAELEQNVQNSGGVFADYLSSINKTSEQLGEEFKAQALQRVKTSLALRAIVAAEKISVDDEEIKKEIEALKKRYGHDPKAIETIESAAYRRHIESMLLNRAAITKLISWNS